MSDQQIQKVKVKRLSGVGLWSADVLSQARFYIQVLGLALRATTENDMDEDVELADTNMFFGLEEERHCLGLYSDTRPAPSNGRRPILRTPLHHLTFEVDTAAEQAALAARLQQMGVEITLDGSSDDPEMSTSLWFSDPDGNRVEIAVASEDILLPSTTSARRLSAPRPHALQRIALYTPHLESMVDFYTEALGFDISDWLLRERAWLRCNSNHHTLLFILGKQGIDSLGFSIADGMEMLRWADHLSQRQVPLLWGPGRHGAGNDLFIRFADPEGMHVELSAEMQQYYDRDVTIPPRLWHTRSMALNLWGALPSWIREEVQV